MFKYDIVQFLDIIAYHPGTAQHIAGKLCRRFVSETPSQALIDEVANTFYLPLAALIDQTNWQDIFYKSASNK